MAIEIQYIDDGIGIEIIATGVVTGEEIIEAHKEIYSKTNLKKQKYQIIDRTHCEEYQVSSAEVQRIADIDNTAAKTNPNIIMALISPTDVQFGMSRMWEAFIGDSTFVTQVFRDRKRADEWVNKQLNKT